MASSTSPAASGSGKRENLPIEVKFSRRVVADADPYAVRLSFIVVGLPLSLRGPTARGNPFSFRPLWGPGGASHHIGCGLPRRFAARNDILFADRSRCSADEFPFFPTADIDNFPFLRYTVFGQLYKKYLKLYKDR